VTLENILIANIHRCFPVLIFHHPSIHGHISDPVDPHLIQNIVDDEK
jgi:hypothetical protein